MNYSKLLESSAVGPLLAIATMQLFLLATSNLLIADIVTFDSRTAFLSTTSATANDPIPNSNGTVTTLTVGDLTFTTPSPSFASDEFSIRLPGNVISVTDTENLNISFSTPVFSFGFDFHEPEFDPGLFDTFIDSTFNVELFVGNSSLGAFAFNAPNDTASFVGVGSNLQFDRVEIRETTGGIENEFFGQTYTGIVPVPEPNTVFVLVTFTVLLSGCRRKHFKALTQ